MNKQELIDRVADATGEARSRAAEFVEATFDTLQTAMARGEEVAIPGFGKFGAKARAARMGRNPQTGAEVKIPATTIPVFRAASALKQIVSGKAKLTLTKTGGGRGSSAAGRSSASKRGGKSAAKKVTTGARSTAKRATGGAKRKTTAGAKKAGTSAKRSSTASRRKSSSKRR